MSNVNRCLTCLGQKTIMGMGMVNKTCHDCSGVGFAEALANINPPVSFGSFKSFDDPSIDKNSLVIFDEPVKCIPRPRGRPKKT